MPYERREHPVPRAINYHRVYSRKNWQKRVEYRGIYERVLLGRNSYGGSVITSTPTDVGGPCHRFYLDNTFIVSVEVAYPVFKPTLHFVRTDYNKFRLFLRNLGIYATGRKHITTIRLPTGKSLRFDHLEGPSFSYPPIRFLSRREDAIERPHARLDGPVSRTGEQLQQDTFTITWDNRRVIYAVRREAEHQVLQVLYDSLQTQPGPTSRLNRGTSSEGNPLRQPDSANVTQQFYPFRSTPTSLVTDQQIWD